MGVDAVDARGLMESVRRAVYRLNAVNLAILNDCEEWKPPAIGGNPGTSDPTAAQAIYRADVLADKLDALQSEQRDLENLIARGLAAIERVREEFLESAADALEWIYIDLLTYGYIAEAYGVAKSTTAYRVEIALDWLDSVGITNGESMPVKRPDYYLTEAGKGTRHLVNVGMVDRSGAFLFLQDANTSKHYKFSDQAELIHELAEDNERQTREIAYLREELEDNRVTVESRAITIDVAAALIGCRPGEISKLRDEGKLEYLAQAVGKRKRVTIDSVCRYILGISAE